MIFKNSLIYINQFFFFIFSYLRNFYLNSKIYNIKISKVNSNNLEYKPSLSLMGCIIKYSNNKKNIKEFLTEKFWSHNALGKKDFRKLNSFFWLFSLDLNSSKEDVQKIILNWIVKNNNYNNLSWEVDILSKRVIAWISSYKLTYEDSNENYKYKFDNLIKKQINHLINEIQSSKKIDNKMIGCAAIILGGLAYQDKNRFLNYGLNLLKKIIKSSFDKNGFPKSRNLRQLSFYLKYFILIREWFKESQNEIPEYLDEIIYHLGQAFTLINQKYGSNFLFNGGQISDNSNLENYIKRLGYNFKIENYEIGGYIFLKNKKFHLAMDIGNSPDKKFSKDYQSGALSFELISNGNKIVSNSGYFQNYKHQLNLISKSTACHSTVAIENSSSVQFQKNSNGETIIKNNLKIINKNINVKKNHWVINASHDGYLRRYGIIHDRKIEYYQELNKIIGTDKIINKKKDKQINFEIRFHLDPITKLMKTQDKSSVFIDCNNEAWKFYCDKYNITFETGLFFGQKNNFIENQNIFISGIINNDESEINWVIEKI